jgi:hypothetical protein
MDVMLPGVCPTYTFFLVGIVLIMLVYVFVLVFSFLMVFDAILFGFG